MIDPALARRLERAEGLANVAFVESRARLDPQVAATWIEVAGTLACFDGPASPLTQTFGLGLGGPPSPADLDELEAFFAARGAPAVVHEVSPAADPATTALLAARGYAAGDRTAQLVRDPAEPPPPGVAGVVAAPVEAADRDRWAEASGAGWATAFAAMGPEAEALCRDLARVASRAAGAQPFAVTLPDPASGAPTFAGTASVRLVGGVALLAGAATVPAFRRRGAQRALLVARLAWAAAAGATTVTMGASPGSESLRNALRVGFREAAVRTQWVRPLR